MNTPVKLAKSGNYHHGNLKHELVACFLSLLKTLAAEKISLRKLAAELGVAPTAVYNHFANKDELIVAVKEECLQHLTQYLEKSAKKGETPKQRLCELGRGYFTYSVEHVAYFEMIFQTEVADSCITESFVEKAMQAESALRAVVVDLLEENNIPSTQYNEGLGAFAVWSLAHGISLLSARHVNHAACMQGSWPPEFMLGDRASIMSSFEAMAELLVGGILHAARRD